MTPVEKGSTCSTAQTGELGQGLATGDGVRQATLAGARVGVAGVDQQVAGRGRLEVAPRHHHGRGAEGVAGEYGGAGAHRTGSSISEQVLAIRVADAGGRGAQAYPGTG